MNETAFLVAFAATYLYLTRGNALSYSKMTESLPYVKILVASLRDCLPGVAVPTITSSFNLRTLKPRVTALLANPVSTAAITFLSLNVPLVASAPWTRKHIPPQEVSTTITTYPSVFNAVTLATLILTLGLTYFVVTTVLTTYIRSHDPSRPPVVTPLTRFGNFKLLTFLEFSASPLKCITRLYSSYGEVFTMNMMGQNITILLGPSQQSHFFKLGDDHLSQQEVYKFMKPVFGAGVVYDCSPRTRQSQFQAMAHGLRNVRLKGYVKKIEAETQSYLSTKFGQSGTVDLLEALSELTILTSSRCLHGDDVRENMFKEVAELYHDLDKGVTPLSVFFPYAWTEAHKKRDAARKRMVDLFSTVIKARRAETEEEAKSKNRTDILDVFMNATYKNGEPFKDEEITGLLIALLFAGQHTSSITSTWTSLFIANDPSIMQRVIQEQDTVVGGDRDLTFDDINNMPLLHNCMREALRLHPPLVLLMRKVLKDLKVKAGGKDYVIPKGDVVMVSPSVGMRLESVFPKADSFDPDRYAPPREEHKTPFAYLGFGGGMHSCMGQAFAFVQVKTILSVLFRKYKVEVVPDELPECDYEAMVVGPKGDCRVRYEMR
ncbi:hypothetical protein TrVE_jg10559 [Triparma verrucosa]|uniref:Uncharacterized protein n=1 Tax=Triparma verrucosa TaxID=1606542 RepID=A0A9W7FG71_9STRA|nr:hypothetical protein TrVE_jg10559 [Triparma verrucosa]